MGPRQTYLKTNQTKKKHKNLKAKRSAYKSTRENLMY